MGSIFYLFLILGALTKINSDSTEEQQLFNYNQAYAPHAVGFHDIYPHSNAVVPEEPSSTTDEDFHQNTISTQFVEFHPQVLKIQPMTPGLQVQLNSSDTKHDESAFYNQSTTIPSSMTPEPDEGLVKVAPVKHYQRGVLDLLLPASRVKTFKSVFDTFRRMLSYTFKRR